MKDKKQSRIKLTVNKVFMTIFIVVILSGVLLTFIHKILEIQDDTLFVIGIIIMFAGAVGMLTGAIVIDKIETVIANTFTKDITTKESGQLSLSENKPDEGSLSVPKQNGELSNK